MAVSAPQQNIKHQLYRHADAEVVLVRESKWDKNEDGSKGKITDWLVRPVTRERNELVLGEAYEVAAGELSWLGRTIIAPEV
jgi:hypothetical protein